MTFVLSKFNKVKKAVILSFWCLNFLFVKAQHISTFVSVDTTGNVQSFTIPSTHSFQVLVQHGDNIGGFTFPDYPDFTAFVPINGSSEQGKLVVNSEMNPGSVSNFNINFSSGNTWSLSNGQSVNFGALSTARPCSGAITAWGTVMSGEEINFTQDLNNDGYYDHGWIIEIDPFTNVLRDYNNDGLGDKLWAMGRMSHENVTISTDSITAYYGEDASNNAFIYKFIADSAGNFSKGKLFVLKLDTVNGTWSQGKWKQVPNTTQWQQNNTVLLAQQLGATNFSGIEDVEINPLNNKIYFASKTFGRVYRFSNSDTLVNDFETYVENQRYRVHTNYGQRSILWGNGNDNLAFDNAGNLWVMQDGTHNYIWLVRHDHSMLSPQIELFATLPEGSEPTGINFSPDNRFMFMSIQHPWNSNVSTQQDVTGRNIRFDRDATLVVSRTENFISSPLFISGLELQVSQNDKNQVELKGFCGHDLTGCEVYYQKLMLNDWVNITQKLEPVSSHLPTALDLYPQHGDNWYRVLVKGEKQEFYRNIATIYSDLGINAVVDIKLEGYALGINCKSVSSGALSISNAEGKLCFTKHINLFYSNYSFNYKELNLTPGVYIVRYISDNGKESVVRKMVL